MTLIVRVDYFAERGSRRASSRGIIPRAKVKTVKMTIVIVIGKATVFRLAYVAQVASQSHHL